MPDIEFRGSHLKISLIDPEKLVKVNDLKEVTNPVFFVRNSVPTPDGLLSNEIFGITRYDRANTFAYIDLHEVFINPLLYKNWVAIDSNVRMCVHGLSKFRIDDNGELIEDPENGENGIKFLQKNINKIKFKRSTSSQRDLRVDLLEKYRGTPEMFITKMIVCPPYYRDVDSGDGRAFVGQLNEFYRNLIVFVKALKESSDYGFSLSDANRGRIQDILVQIYDFFGSGAKISPKEKTRQLIPGKLGVLRATNIGKTTDYASRVVLSAPNLAVERLEDIEADLDYSVVPLASICVNFLPFMIYHIRRYFDNEFSGDSVIPYIVKGEATYLHPKDPMAEFSDERIHKEIDRFCTGFANRLIPIEVDTEEGIRVKLRFKGYNMTADQYAKSDIGKLPIMERDLTWCDILYQAAVEATRDKHIMITRYPINSVA